MKKTLISMLALTACVCTSVTVVMASANTKSTGSYTVKDVTDNLPQTSFSVTDYEGNPLNVGVAGPESNDVTYTLAALNDGIENSWSAISPLNSAGNKTFGWFIVDLGSVMPVNGISVTMMHDWGGQDVILQTSETAEFDNAITIYNNDLDGSMGHGNAFTADSAVPVSSVLKNWGNYGDSFDKGGNEWKFSPVAARYVRFTNTQHGDGSAKDYSACGEINVYSYEYSATPQKTDEVAPVMASLTSGEYSAEQTLTVKSVYSNADIYYTTDGSVPTKNSVKYSGPLTLKTDKNYDLRFINVVNGVSSLPVDYSFKLDPAGTNVALGKRATLTSLDGATQLYAVNWDANPDDVMKITDGSFNADGNCIRLASYNEGTNTYTHTVGWATVDLGRIYSVDKIAMATWHNWSFSRVVIQVAQSEDFSDAVTIYSNDDSKEDVVKTGPFTIDENVSTHWQLHNHGAVGNTVEMNGNIWNFPSPVECRYVRVTNRAGDPSNTFLTELQVFAASENESPAAESVNVAFGKKATLTTLNGATQLYAIDLDGKLDNVMKITDGNFHGDNCVRLGSYDSASDTYAPSLGWATIDLGRVYRVDKIAMSMWQSWGFKQVVIQVAKSADFSDAVTVYSNDDQKVVVQTGAYSMDDSVSTHWSLSNTGAVGSTYEMNGNIWQFPELECRYVRVTDNTNDPATTYLTELQVFGKPVITVNNYEYVEYVTAVETTQESLVLKVGNEKDAVDEKLNELIHITLADGSTRNVKGTWQIDDYNKDVTATYTATLIPDEDGDAYGLLDGITVELKVVKYFVSVEATDKTYDGSPATVNITSDEEGYTVKYYNGDTLLDAAPVNAGTYKVVVEIGTGSDYVRIEKSYTINKAALATFTASAENKTYDGEAVAINVTTSAQYVIKYYKDETLLDNAPVNAGSYKAVVTVPESENYLSQSAECTFIIGKASAGTVTVKVEDKTYDGEAVAINVTASAQYVIKYYKDETLLDNAPVNAGYYKVVVEVSETENTFGASPFKYFTISKADLTISVKADGKVYDGQPATVKVEGASEYTLTWRLGDKALESAPVNAGSYTVTAVVEESENYFSAIKEGTLVISKAAFNADVKYVGKNLTVGDEAPTVADFTYAGEGTLEIEVPEIKEGVISIGYKFTPANGNYEVSTGTVDVKVDKPSDATWIIVVSVLGGVLVLGAGAAVAIILIKKSKKKVK